MVTIGDRLKYARQRRNLTQKDLSKQSGITVTCISEAERNVHGMSFFTACALADTLNISLDYLAGRGDFLKRRSEKKK